MGTAFLTQITLSLFSNQNQLIKPENFEKHQKHAKSTSNRKKIIFDIKNDNIDAMQSTGEEGYFATIE